MTRHNLRQIGVRRIPAVRVREVVRRLTEELQIPEADLGPMVGYSKGATGHWRKKGIVTREASEAFRQLESLLEGDQSPHDLKLSKLESYRS
jgi:hypothetical protein